MAEGLMTKNGLEMVRMAKETGIWSALYDVENLILPDDLKAAFESDLEARMYWEAFSRSVKRGILKWIHTAK